MRMVRFMEIVLLAMVVVCDARATMRYYSDPNIIRSSTQDRTTQKTCSGSFPAFSPTPSSSTPGTPVGELRPAPAGREGFVRRTQEGFPTRSLSTRVDEKENMAGSRTRSESEDGEVYGMGRRVGTSRGYNSGCERVGCVRAGRAHRPGSKQGFVKRSHSFGSLPASHQDVRSAGPYLPAHASPASQELGEEMDIEREAQTLQRIYRPASSCPLAIQTQLYPNFDFGANQF